MPDTSVTPDPPIEGVEQLRLSPFAVTLPARFGGTVDDATWPYVVHLSLTFDGRVQCEEITCRRREDGAPVTSEGMTKIRVAELVYQVARRWADEQSMYFSPDENQGPIQVVHKIAAPAPPAGRAGPDHAHLRFVALTYTIAYACGGNPRREVMQELNLSRTTANRWIRMAREAGLLLAGGGDDDGES